ncbi:CRISPR-associated endoribonuclease Cas6 [Defluviitalea phaphyphila]|uniref:CRISPR-associated endoribonuclease Cas6 n=1 Tax=Defluviitalea phaphyphila TaxID=1473580 RepID=UPI000730BA96|nr:CRISPR-associated endoribonuclease Cas6 [Defluviitalea phaphyphila]
MRLKFEFILTKNQLPLDYRRIFISFFKKALENNDKNSKEKYYHNADPIKKAFTFSVLLDKPKFYKDYIELQGNKVILNFSTYSYEIGIDYYNSILKMLNYAYPLKNENYLILKNIVHIKDINIKQDTILIKTLSPILIRKHDRNSNFDAYITPFQENFTEEIRKNLKFNIEKLGLNNLKEEVDSFEFIDIGKGKEVKVLFYNHKILGSIGQYLIKGSPKLLDFILKAGIGSRTSSGFGMVEIEGVSK